MTQAYVPILGSVGTEGAEGTDLHATWLPFHAASNLQRRSENSIDPGGDKNRRGELARET